MRAKILLLLALLSPIAAVAQTGCTPGGGVSCTPVLNLWLPPQHYPRWDIPINANATAIDTFAGGVVLLSPTTSQTVQQPTSTFTNFNSPLVFGSPAILEFGPSQNVFDSALTRTAGGQFTLDANVPGAAGGNLKLRSLNATTGLQINGLAPAGHVLCGNGVFYIDCASLPGAIYYQTVAASGTPSPQRPTLNFTSAFTVSDSASPAQTTIDLAASGITPGTYVNPTMTLNANGIVTAISNGNSIPQIESLTVGGCTISTGGSYSTCSVPVVWPAAFADVNYSVACTGYGPTGTGGEYQAYIAGIQTGSQTPSGVTMLIATGGTAYPQGFSLLECMAIHH